jgi:hypothetical protein
MDTDQLEVRVTNDVMQAVEADISCAPLDDAMTHETTSMAGSIDGVPMTLARTPLACQTGVSNRRVKLAFQTGMSRWTIKP